MDEPECTISGKTWAEQAATKQVASPSLPPGSPKITSSPGIPSTLSMDTEEPAVKRSRCSHSSSPSREDSSHSQSTIEKTTAGSRALDGGVDGGSSSHTYPLQADVSHFSVGNLMEYPELSLEDYLVENFEQKVQQLPRQWEVTEMGANHQAGGDIMAVQGNRRSPVTFTLMSYNILAQDLICFNPDLYTRSSPDSLDWGHRRHRLMAEIAYHNADILNLQEVQEDHFFNYLQPRLEKMGYMGCYQKRTGDKTDGCATLWKTDKFQLLRSTPVTYCRGGLLDRDNVAVLVLLQPLRPGQRESPPDPEDKLLVANTHVLFNPRRGDIKLAQLMILLAEIDKHAYLGPPLEDRHTCTASATSRDHTTGKKRHCPVVMTGDFNMEPHCDLYRFLICGTLKYEGLVAKDMSGQQDNGWYGSTYYLSRHFLSPMYGVTDLSQYYSVVGERFQQYRESRNSRPPASLDTHRSGSDMERDQNNSRQRGEQGSGASLQKGSKNSHAEQTVSSSFHEADGPPEARVNIDGAAGESSDSSQADRKEKCVDSEVSSDSKERSKEKRSDKRRDRSSDKRDRNSDRSEKTSDRRDRSSDKRDRSSDKRDRSSDRRDRSSDKRDRSSDKRDRSSDRRDRSSDRRDRSSDKRRDRSSDKRRDRSSDRRDRSSDKRDRSSDKRRDRSSDKRRDRSSDRRDRSSDKRDRSSDRRDRSSDRRDRSSDKRRDRSSDKRDRSSDKRRDRSSDRRDRSSDKRDRSSDKRDQSSDKRRDRSSDKRDRSSDKRDRSSDKGERSSDKGERSSDKGERSSDKGERSSDKEDKSSDKGERSSDKEDKSLDKGERSSDKEERSCAPEAGREDCDLSQLTPCSSGSLSHGFNLFSAYRHKVQRLGDEQEEVSTHHSRAECTVDYVFYSVDSKDVCVNEEEEEVEVRMVEEGPLKLLGRYGLMSGPELDELGGIPNWLLPSDHLCLVTQFLLQ